MSYYIIKTHKKEDININKQWDMTFSEHHKFETIDRAQIIQFFSIPALLNPTCSFSFKKNQFFEEF